MKVLVTGANGYVGRYVVKHLLALGHQVVVATRGDSPVAEGVARADVDILSAGPDVFDRLGRPDVCIHMAWEKGFMHSSPAHIGNVDRHVQFIRNMLTGGLKQIVGIGTMHEVGHFVGPVTEDTPTNPFHGYGIAKNYLQRVQMLLAREHGAHSQWLRCYYIVGDDRRNNSIFRKMFDAADAGKTEFPLNSGEMLYDFIDVDELGAQIAKVSLQTEVAGIINCCSGVPTSLRTMVLRFIERHALPLKPNWGAFPLRPYDSLAIWGDRSKLDRALSAYSAAFNA